MPSLGISRRDSMENMSRRDSTEGGNLMYSRRTSISLDTRGGGTLEQIFPKKIIEALKCDVGDDVAEHHPSVSVLMADIVGFTAWCSEVSPRKVIECLSSYFQVLDDLAESFGVYKVETVGDGYQAICGAPTYREDHAEVMSLFALKIIQTLPMMRKIFDSDDFHVRVGINSGPIVTGVIRADRIRWQLFGDTVNVASRMESTSVPGKIQISKSTRELLLYGDNFEVEKRGVIDVKGKGQQETYFLVKVKDDAFFESKMLSRTATLSESIHEITRGNDSKHGTPKKAEGQADNSTQSPRTAQSLLTVRTSPRVSVSDIETKPVVLLVDDLLSILLQYTRLLQREGMVVVTARNGLEGLEQLKKGSFDCCFCDIHMPKMDGLQCVKLYREWEKQNRPGKLLPIYALTGQTDHKEHVDSYIANGFNEVISKTNYKEVLLNYVKESVHNKLVLNSSVTQLLSN